MLPRAIDAFAMVLNMNPVANIFAVAVYRNGPILKKIRYEKRDQFFGELVGPVVIRTPGDHGVHVKRVTVTTDQQIPRCLAGRIGAARCERSCLREVSSWAQTAIHLIGRHLDETLHAAL